MSDLSLYQLSDEYRRVARALADVDDPEAVRDTLEAVREPLERKAIGVASVIRNFEALAASMKQEEERMAVRRKALERQATWLKGYVQGHMELSGLTEIQAPAFRLVIRQNPGAVTILEPRAVPAKYLVMPEPSQPYADKRRIAEDLKAGREVPGCVLTKSTRLEIK